MDLYAEQILDHYRHPRGQTPLLSPTVSHTEKNTSCGDELTILLDVKDDRIAGVSWTGTGCAVSQAGMSLLSEELIGKSVDVCRALSAEDLKTLLGVPIGPRRVKCALLCLHALKNALRISQGKDVQSWTETLGDTA